MENTTFTVSDDQKTLTIERTFKAPRSKVWAAWTTPELFAQWWGPKGWTTTVKHMNFTVGGELLYAMKCEDPEQTDWFGKYSCGLSTYTAIDAENSFSYSDAFCEEDGTVIPGMPVTNIDLSFVVDGDATRLVSTCEFDSAEALKQVIDMGMQEGLAQTWDRLETIVS